MMRALRVALLAAAVVAVGPVPGIPATPAPSVTVEGAQFRIMRADGSVVSQLALPGTILTVGDGSGARRRLRIDAVEPDPSDLTGELMLYTLSEQQAVDGPWQNVCLPGPDGRRQAFPLAGRFTAEGRYLPAPDRILITCTGGAEGKCVRFGYKPWATAPNGAPLAHYYRACVRLVRADYCGDGVGHTRDGTPIDIFDRIGVQADEPRPDMSFEAAFGPEGAVCVRHTRIPALFDLDRLKRQCPGLADRVEAGCDETAPGLLFVRSAG